MRTLEDFLEETGLHVDFDLIPTEWLDWIVSDIQPPTYGGVDPRWESFFEWLTEEVDIDMWDWVEVRGERTYFRAAILILHPDVFST